MKKREDVTGLILAGGLSRRFGVPKATFVVQGRPMLAYVYDALYPLVRNVLVSVQELGMDFGLPVTYVPDKTPGLGPLAGIHAGMQAAETSWLLVVAVDMPFVTSGILEQLVDARNPSLQPVVARSESGSPQPLCACYPTVAHSIVENLLHQNRLAVRELLQELGPAIEVIIPDEHLLNVNYRTDLSE